MDTASRADACVVVDDDRSSVCDAQTRAKGVDWHRKAQEQGMTRMNAPKQASDQMPVRGYAGVGQPLQSTKTPLVSDDAVLVSS